MIAARALLKAFAAAAPLAIAIAAAAGAGAGEPPQVRVATTANNSELVKTLPITRRAGAEKRVVMSMKPGPLPDLATGDRLRVTAELQVTNNCNFRSPRCVGPVYHYAPMITAGRCWPATRRPPRAQGRWRSRSRNARPAPSAAPTTSTIACSRSPPASWRSVIRDDCRVRSRAATSTWSPTCTIRELTAATCRWSAASARTGRSPRTAGGSTSSGCAARRRATTSEARPPSPCAAASRPM